MDEIAIAIVVLYALFEYIEFNLQRGESLKDVLLYNLSCYRQNIVVYLLSHSTFFMLLILVFALGVDGAFIYIALFMKGADIVLKLYLIGKINKEGDSALSSMLGFIEMPIGKNMKIFNSCIYITLVALAVIG